MPDIKVFLDVDDLEEIGDLEGYIDRSLNILVFCSDGYFDSKNCMRELISATIKKKPIIPLIETESKRGGLSLEEVKVALLRAEGLFVGWGFDPDSTPNAQALYDHLFAHESIEWNRLGHFQDVTMRLISERLLPPSMAGMTFVGRELISTPLAPLPRPDEGPTNSVYHIYCSEHNPGARELMAEVSEKMALGLEKDSSTPTLSADNPAAAPSEVDDLPPTIKLARLPTINFAPPSPAKNQVNGQASAKLKKKSGTNLTIAPPGIEHCLESDHMLLYLNSKTWTRGEDSAALAADLKMALDNGVHILLAHEMRGSGLYGQTDRYGCDFSEFFSNPDGATPQELVRSGIYSEIAVALKGGPWRQTSLHLLTMALGSDKERAVPEKPSTGKTSRIRNATRRMQKPRDLAKISSQDERLAKRPQIDTEDSISATEVRVVTEPDSWA